MESIKTEAARLLSIDPKEVHDVENTTAAAVVRTTDGVAYVLTDDGEGGHQVAFLVKPTKSYAGAFPVAYPDLSEQEALRAMGVEVDEPEPKPADPDAPDGPADDAAHPGELDATAAALAASAEPPTEPAPAPGPEHAGQTSADAAADAQVKAEPTAEPVRAPEPVAEAREVAKSSRRR